MNCDEFVEKVTDHLEGALSGEDRPRADEHLEVCWGCVNHLGEVRVTLQLLSGLDAEPLSDQLESALLHEFRRWAETARA